MLQQVCIHERVVEIEDRELGLRFHDYATLRARLRAFSGFQSAGRALGLSLERFHDRRDPQLDCGRQLLEIGQALLRIDNAHTLALYNLI